MFSLFFHLENFWHGFTIKKTHLCPVNCKCGRMNYDLVRIQSVFCVFQGVWVYIDVLNAFYSWIYGSIPKHTYNLYNPGYL
jgi:hypothetical protein